MTSRLALLALLTLPLAACEGANLPGFGAEEDQPQVAGHQGPPGVSPLEQPIETGTAEPRAVATAEAATLNTAAFSARGNEPFWAVDVAGSTAIYKTPDNQKGRAVRVNRLAFAEGVEYVGVLNGRPFVLTVRGRACQDSMADETFPMTASLTVSGRSNQGCARPATAEVAAAVAAIRAPAPPAPRARAVAPKPAATRPAATPAATTTPAPEATTTPTTPDTPATPPSVTPAPATMDSPTPATDATAPATSGTVVPAPSLQLPSTPPALPPAPASTEPAASADDGGTTDGN